MEVIIALGIVQKVTSSRMIGPAGDVKAAEYDAMLYPLMTFYAPSIVILLCSHTLSSASKSLRLVVLFVEKAAKASVWLIRFNLHQVSLSRRSIERPFPILQISISQHRRHHRQVVFICLPVS